MNNKPKLQSVKHMRIKKIDNKKGFKESGQA